GTGQTVLPVSVRQSPQEAGDGLLAGTLPGSLERLEDDAPHAGRHVAVDCADVEPPAARPRREVPGRLPGEEKLLGERIDHRISFSSWGVSIVRPLSRSASKTAGRRLRGTSLRPATIGQDWTSTLRW